MLSQRKLKVQQSNKQSTKKPCKDGCMETMETLCLHSNRYHQIWKKGQNFMASWNNSIYLSKCHTIFLGGVHKLRLQDLAFFDHLPPSVYIFYGVNVYKKSIFLTTYPMAIGVVEFSREGYKIRKVFA